MHTNHKCYSLFAIKGHMAGEKESAQAYKQVKMNMCEHAVYVPK